MSVPWILWGFVVLNALCWLVVSLTPGDPGGRWLYRIQGLIWLIGCTVTTVLPISKLHVLWIYPLGAITPYAIMRWRIQRQADMGTSASALIIRRHLAEESGGEVWNWPEMLRVFKVHGITSPKEFAKRIEGPEFSGWWIANEPGVGEVKVIRRVDKAKGALYFKDSPRFYFGWHQD